MLFERFSVLATRWPRGRKRVFVQSAAPGGSFTCQLTCHCTRGRTSFARSLQRRLSDEDCFPSLGVWHDRCHQRVLVGRPPKRDRGVWEDIFVLDTTSYKFIYLSLSPYLCLSLRSQPPLLPSPLLSLSPSHPGHLSLSLSLLPESPRHTFDAKHSSEWQEDPQQVHM